MRKLSLLPIAAVIAVATGCAGPQGGAADRWAAAETTRTKSARATVDVELLRLDDKSYEYWARLRHYVNPGSDSIERQQALSQAVEGVAADICGAAVEPKKRAYLKRDHELLGRFDCPES